MVEHLLLKLELRTRLIGIRVALGAVTCRVAGLPGTADEL